MRIGFNGVANHAGKASESPAHPLIVVENGALAIDVRRGAKLVGNRGERQILAEELAIAIMKGIFSQ